MRERREMNLTAESLGNVMRISTVYRRKVSTKATMLLFRGGGRRLVITMRDARCEMKVPYQDPGLRRRRSHSPHRHVTCGFARLRYLTLESVVGVWRCLEDENTVSEWVECEEQNEQPR